MPLPTLSLSAAPPNSKLADSEEGGGSASSLLNLPLELQVNLLTYLRAYDLSALQLTCRFYANPVLADAIVRHVYHHVYPNDLTHGLIVASETSDQSTNLNAEAAVTSSPTLYTVEVLRNMELRVIARVLQRPEPSSGYFVSKSWCKSALRWLEQIQEQQQGNKKKGGSKATSKKKQRQRRRLADAATAVSGSAAAFAVSPPWSNVNSDLLCEHECLQRCSNNKTARARRRLLDKQAWKILKKLYPDSTQLESAVGECLQCTLEAETIKRQEETRVEQAKLERKRPLANPMVRQFYTRTRGFPTHALRTAGNISTPPHDGDDENYTASDTTLDCDNSHNDCKPSASCVRSSQNCCPLQDGVYYMLPRVWCHGWRRYIKGGNTNNSFGPPDGAGLLCDAHRLLLLPPHLEAFLSGQAPQLLGSGNTISTTESSLSSSASLPPSVVPGQADQATVQAMRAAGLTPSQIGQQIAAMQSLEQQRQHQIQRDAVPPPPANSNYNNDQLDRENHSVVEILTRDEFLALVEQCWETSSSTVFSLSFTVQQNKIVYGTEPCRECDASGRSCVMSIKNRARGWIRKSADKPRAPASLEY